MNILVSDTSVLIDIERSRLEEAIFRIGHTLVVPDLLYDQELHDYGGEQWCARGLQVITLDENETSAAQALAKAQKSVSLIDCSAFTLAERRQWTLLAGDGALRKLASTNGLECHGFLWVADQIEATDFDRGMLADAIERVLNHARCRLPQDECRVRIARLRTPR